MHYRFRCKCGCEIVYNVDHLYKPPRTVTCFRCKANISRAAEKGEVDDGTEEPLVDTAAEEMIEEGTVIEEPIQEGA